MPSLSTCTKMTLFILHTRSILAIGIPVMVGEMCWLVSNLLILSILSCLTHATQAQAAWAIHLKIEETIGYLPLMACCQATATLVGNRLGAGDAGGARQIARHLARRAALAMLAVGCATALAAPYIVPFVSADGQVRQLAQQLLISSIVTFPVNAVALVLSAALEGAGATTLPMVVNVVGLVVVRLPLAWIFAMPLGWGVVGAWAAKCLSNLITFSGMVQVFGRLAPKFGTAR
jgi:Na+-driven multidrug efflux pump